MTQDDVALVLALLAVVISVFTIMITLGNR